MRTNGMGLALALLLAGCENGPGDPIDAANARDDASSAVDGGGTAADAQGPGIDSSAPGDSGTPVVTGCSAAAIELIGLVNDYRADNGLPAIPASPSLCTVAAAH